MRISLGQYDLGGLPTGTYRLEFVDESGAYLSEYYNNAATLDAATGVAVTAGSTTPSINAQLAVAGHIKGKVTNSGNIGIFDVGVTAYSLQDGYWDWYQNAGTDSSGNYDIGGLPTGTYRLEFTDDSGKYVSEFYNNVATLDAGTGVAVTAGSTTPNINAQLASPVISPARSRTPAGSVSLTCMSPRIRSRTECGTISGYLYGVNGTYDLGGLPAGTYRLEFYDSAETYLSEYYDNVATLDAAKGVAVTAGSTTPNINAQLASAGHITGKVTNPGGTRDRGHRGRGVLASGRSMGLLPGHRH